MSITNDRQTPYSLGKAIEIITKKISYYERRVLEKTELSSLSGTQLLYIGKIYHSGSPTITELSEELSVSKPSVSVIVDKLLQKGFVDKRKSDSDGRSYRLHLTKSGRRCAVFHDSIYGRFASKVKKILDGKELDQLISLLGKIIERLS
jgi:DNA-binding MarR family transcriptional regulator